MEPLRNNIERWPKKCFKRLILFSNFHLRYFEMLNKALILIANFNLSYFEKKLKGVNLTCIILKPTVNKKELTNFSTKKLLKIKYCSF